jgi:hypothetical protein
MRKVSASSPVTGAKCSTAGAEAKQTGYRATYFGALTGPDFSLPGGGTTTRRAIPMTARLSGILSSAFIGISPDCDLPALPDRGQRLLERRFVPQTRRDQQNRQ